MLPRTSSVLEGGAEASLHQKPASKTPTQQGSVLLRTESGRRVPSTVPNTSHELTS